jgi:hypothetical protein
VRSAAFIDTVRRKRPVRAIGASPEE